MKPASEIISRPILTEKASGLAEANKYVFEVTICRTANH